MAQEKYTPNESDYTSSADIERKKQKLLRSEVHYKMGAAALLGLTLAGGLGTYNSYERSEKAEVHAVQEDDDALAEAWHDEAERLDAHTWLALGGTLWGATGALSAYGTSLVYRMKRDELSPPKSKN